MSAKKGATLKKEWNAGQLPALLVHPASAGHGLNLQAGGHHIVWFCPPWDLELYDQMNRRLWRQGQDAKRVFVYHIVGQDTVDQRATRVLKKKDRTQADLKAALTED